jgi:hypothetical protein
MLTRTNYQEWAMLMQVNFEAARWWDVVEPEEGGGINYRHDRLALAAIMRSVPADMLSSLHGRRSSAAAAWEAIKRIHIGVQRVREANAQQLRLEFGALVWKEAEKAEDFANRITELTANLRTLGDNISDAEVVRKMLQVVPDHLTQVAVSIETLLDIKNISMEEVTGMLCAIKERRKPAAAHESQGRLLLYEDEWMAKLKLRESEAKGGGGTSGGFSGSSSMKRGARGRGCANGESSNSGSRDSNKGDSGGGPAIKRDQCKRCGKYDHWARECRSKPKGEAHLTQAEDDSDPTLLMARASLIPTVPPPQTRQIGISPGRRPLRIVEAKVYVQLDEETKRDDSLWYLDSGATNLMPGCHRAFVDIDTSIRGTVKFGDGSEVAIEGSGTVLFEGKTGEHHPLTGVFHPAAHHQHH